MKRIWLIVLFALGCIALAQGNTTPDLNKWFADTASLAAVVAAIMAFARKHFLKSLDGLAVVGVSIAVGAVLAVGGKLLGYLQMDWVPALVFGATAGWIASGGVDLLRSLMGGKSAPAGNTAADYERTRPR